MRQIHAPPCPGFRCFACRRCEPGTWCWPPGSAQRSGPAVIHHSSQFAATRGIQVALLAGLGATAALGLRCPVQIFPVLLFELVWKTIYLIASRFRCGAHAVTAAVAEDIQAVLMVVIFVPLLPWPYVFAHCVVKRGDRWK